MPLPFGYRSAAIRKYVRSDHQRTVARRQAEDVASERARTTAVEELLRRRRNDDPLPIGRRPTRRGGEVLVSWRELLVRRADLTAEARAAIPDGFQVAGVDELRGYVVRIHGPAGSSEGVVQLRDALRALGVDASLCYVTPCRINMKSGATPEEAISVPPAPSGAAETEGSPVAVAILDTGINADERTDTWLSGLQDSDNEDPLNVLPAGGADAFLDLAAGHGTFAAGIVQQVAPAARSVVRRVMDSDGVATELDVAKHLVKAVEDLLDAGGRVVVNLSLGSETEDDEPPIALEAALDVLDDLQAERGGEVMVVAAAGNEGGDRPCWPAAFDRVVAVGALDQEGEPAPWSSRGDWVDCSVIGEAVLSTFVKGDESPDLDPQPETFGDDAWALWTGTSFAAPQVAGAVALIAQQEGRSLRWALQRLLAGRPRRAGYGRTLRILP